MLCRSGIGSSIFVLMLWVVATSHAQIQDKTLASLGSIDSQELATQWEEAREVLLQAREPRPEELNDIFLLFAASARAWVENDLLPTWGRAFLDDRDDEAEQALRTARSIARALAKRNLDQLTKESVDHIDRALGLANEANVTALATAYSAYGDALAHMHDGDVVAALETWQIANSAFTDVGHPFGLWVDYQIALASYYEAVEATEVSMDDILQRVGDRAYWPLLGWCHWMRGLARFKQGLYGLALDDYEVAYEHLLQAQDNSAAAVLGLRSDVYKVLGLVETAWELRLQVIEAAATQGNRPLLHNNLHAAVHLLLDTDQVEEASAWGTELVANAEALGQSGQLAEATLLQGRIRAELGDHEDAQRLFQTSRAHARDLPLGSLRSQLEADVDEALGRLQVQTDPQAAVADLTDALEVRDAAGYTWQRPRLLRDRARAYGHLGDAQQQRKDLETALQEVDRRRKDPGEERFQISYWETVQDLLDDMVRFQALTAQDPEQAYLYAEQSRGRALLDRLRAGWGESDEGDQALEEGFPEVEKIRKIQRLLPKGALLVEAAVLDEHLFLWLLDRKGLELRILGVEAAELTERVEQIRSQMSRRAEEEAIRETAGEMFDLLLGTVADRVRKAEHLIVVPDRTLHRLPWAVLFDRKEKKYLVENHALTVLPSASILTLGRDREPFGTLEEGPVLVVGDPAFNRDVLDLERLPGAAEEAQGVAGLYGRSTHLTDQQATRSQLLEALGQTRVVHVAGHVQVNERDPLQSSIPLTPETEGDLGLLHAREIYDLPLSNVELVVLSACRSVDGFPSGAREGVAGLARAFLAAGAGAVVASLWDVYDAPSRRLMETFHGHFREGVPPAEALRRAQIALIESDDPRFRHPASWAGFEALGWAF